MRDCEKCVYAKPYGGSNDNRCSAWECEFIDRKEAVKFIKSIVRCKDCKHYDTESRTFPCCTDIFGAVRYMEADGFCSKGERRADEHTDKRD